MQRFVIERIGCMFHLDVELVLIQHLCGIAIVLRFAVNNQRRVDKTEVLT